MATKSRGGIVKRFVSKPSKNKKRKVEEVSRSSKKIKIVVKEPKSNSDSDTMAEIDNYEDSSGQATDDAESSEENSNSGDEESNRDSRDTGDEDVDPLSLPTCAREIYGKSYNLTTWMDELGSFLTKISVRARMTLYRDFRNVLVQEKNYNDFKGTCFGHLRHLSKHYKFNGQMVWIYEVFPHLGNYAKKSFDSPLPIPHFLRWHTTKSDNIVEGDPFKYKGRSTKVLYFYIYFCRLCIHTSYLLSMRQKKNYMATLKSYTDEVKDTIIDALNAGLKGVTVLTSAVENVEDEYSNDHNPNQPCENFVPSTSKDESLCECCIPRAINGENCCFCMRKEVEKKYRN
ncbi:hypothetical protein R3W88_011901 [Solanum pinnatisectum]|uniref:Uncharacterized protein n=1 Tax=Solanum pinnatisectum TaxID=50273 RepID=A0AAV9L7Y1_9SOLN|nr:hypothetical protein R3W88_011901 [Solanum pinnatisectum]